MIRIRHVRQWNAKHWLLACTGLAAASTIALMIIAPSRANLHYLGFDRVWSPGQWHVADSFPLRPYDFRIVGNDGDDVYLKTEKLSISLDRFGASFSDSAEIRLDFQDNLLLNDLRTQIYGRDVYLFQSNQPSIQHGRLSGQPTCATYERFGDTYFIEAAPLSSTNVAVMSRLQGRATLGRISTADTPKVWRRGLLEKQVDGFFDSFGHLLSEPDSGRMVYLYRYRNQFLVADTNVMLQYRAHTIDTISIAKIKAGSLDSNTHTMTAPPMPVNRIATIQQGKLYVRSNIRAANETLEDFLGHAVIDTYDLTHQGRYRHSFYLPKRNGKHLTDFRPMPDGSIVALYERELVRYRRQH